MSLAAQTISTFIAALALCLAIPAQGVPQVVEGTWTFKDLTPGTYVLTALAQLPERPAAQEKSAEKDPPHARSADDEPRVVSREIQLTIDQEDLKDITIEPGGSRCRARNRSRLT